MLYEVITNLMRRLGYGTADERAAVFSDDARKNISDTDQSQRRQNGHILV